MGIKFFNNRKSGKPMPIKPSDIMGHEERLELLLRLKPLLANAEQRRHLLFFLFLLLLIVAIIAAAFYTVYVVPFVLGGSNTNSNDFEIVIYGYVALGLICLLPHKLFRMHYKNYITPKIAEALNAKYYKKGGDVWNNLHFFEEQYAAIHNRKQSSLLFNGYSKVKCEDGFEIDFNTRKLAFEEVKIIEKSGDNNRTVFKGLLMEIENRRRSEVPVILSPVNAGSIQRFERITLEDPVFEDMFEVYSPDQISSRKLLTPRFMEKLKKIGEFYGNAAVSALFIEYRVFIAIKIKTDLFEPVSFFTDARDKRNIDSILSQIALQKQVAESLE